VSRRIVTRSELMLEAHGLRIETLRERDGLVCTACHDPWKTHRHYNYSGDLGSCGDFYCYHAVNPVIHDMGQDE
jgi:hypothetical protein